MAFLGQKTSKDSLSTTRSKITKHLKCNQQKEMWTLLKKEAQGNEVGNLLALKGSFRKAIMSKEEILTKFLDRVSGIVDKLADIGEIIPQNEICYLVLTYIPDQYRPIT